MSRLYCFIRGLIAEIPMLWHIARHEACERNGGHCFGDVEQTKVGPLVCCAHCQLVESVPEEQQAAYVIYGDQSNAVWTTASNAAWQ